MTTDLASTDSVRSSRFDLRVPFGFSREVTREAYLIWGVVLFLARYAVEAGVATACGAGFLDPLTFLTPHFARPRSFTIDSGGIGVALAAAALPFLWVGVSMSVRRAASAGLPETFGFLVLVPGLHYAVIAILAALPARPRQSAASPTGPFRQGWPVSREVVETRLSSRRVRTALAVGFLAAVICAPLLVSLERRGFWIFLLSPALASFVASRYYRALFTRSTIPVEAAATKAVEQPAEPGAPVLRGAAVGGGVGLAVVVLAVISSPLFGMAFGYVALLLMVTWPISCLVGALLGGAVSAAHSNWGWPGSYGLGCVLALALPVGLVAAVYLEGPAVLLGSVFAIVAAILGIVIKAIVVPWGGPRPEGGRKR